MDELDEHTLNVSPIVEKIYLLDFYERKGDVIILATSSDYGSYYKYSDQYFNYIPSNFKYGKPNIQRNDVKTTLEQYYPHINAMLTLNKGKLSLVGDCVTSIGKNTTEFDLYCHSCDIDEAFNIILNCTIMSQGKIYYYEDHIGINTPKDYYCKIFKDRVSILKNIETIPFRCGYDHQVRYFSSFGAMLMITTGVSPINIFPNSENLYKCSVRIFSDIFHGINHNVPEIPEQCFHVEIYDYKGSVSYRIGNFRNTQNKEPQEINYDKTKTSLILHKNIKKSSIDPRECFGKNYIPIEIGNTNDQYVAFSNIRKKYNVNNDLFRLLCDTWVNTLILDAKDFFLN